MKFEIDPTPHPAEADMHAMFAQVEVPGVGQAVTDARAAGLSWPTIISLLVQFGPQFVALIKAIIAALNTPTPAPVPAPAPTPSVP